MASSLYQHWCTPPELVAMLRSFGTIALDPCSNAYSMVRALNNWSRGGLHAPSWLERAPELGRRDHFAYVNSPYGAALAPWTARIVLEHERDQIEVVQLCPARFETAWFRAGRDAASSVAVLRRRVRFWKRGRPGDGAFFPSALLYYGGRRETWEAIVSTVADVYRHVQVQVPAAAPVLRLVKPKTKVTR